MKIAAIQMVSTPSPAQNFEVVQQLLAEAAAAGAQLMLLPEYWPLMGLHENDKLAHAEVLHAGPIQAFMAAAARRHAAWLIGGTLPMASTETGKVLNTTLVYNPHGECVARYDKMHLFSFVRGEEAYDEARTIEYGGEAVAFEAPFGRVGLSVCYDLRFPELYRALGDCALMVVPAAFTHTTGHAHWEVLLRARAIENQCYVLAAAQGGWHLNGRRTWGHSMLIDPWGKIIAQRDDGAGIVTGELDLAYLQQVRESLPALRHRRL
jgi:deaminated glutathione amidase